MTAIIRVVDITTDTAINNELVIDENNGKTYMGFENEWVRYP